MRYITRTRRAALGLGLMLLVAVWVARGPAQAQDAPGDGKAPGTSSLTQRELVQNLLKSFAQAVIDNDVEAALRLLPTEEDLKTLLGDANATRSVNELRSHLKLNFHEFVDAYKAFGKCDLVAIEPGPIRRMPKGEAGALTDTFVAENGYISFARDGNYFVELRFNVAGLLRINKDRWVMSAMQTRADKFGQIDVNSP